MVKSNVRAMPKPRRKVFEITPEFIKQVEELRREFEEARVKDAEVLARAEETRKWLRRIASR